MNTQITVKDVSRETFNALKTEAVKRRINVGTALSLAIKSWLSSIKQTRRKLSTLKPTDWGPGTETLSEDFDETLYGGV